VNEQKEQPKLIKTWAELKECKSETHILEIDDCCGWIRKKDGGEDDYGIYLSTHTFYGGTHEWSTKTLQSCGFNVVLANWDELGW
jgi:effector-binding domain-containing protein